MLEKTKITRSNLSVLGILIRVARIKQGYSLRSLSAVTNISHTLISNIEQGKQPPSEATLSDIFRVLNLKLHTDGDVEAKMDYYYKSIFTHIVNHHYDKAHVLINEMEKNGEMYEHSFEVVNFLIIRCLFYTITDTYLEEKEKVLSQYEKVLDFFTVEQKQLFYFIKGLNFLNKDNFKQASDYFEIALTIGNKDLDVVIKEYLVRAYIRQYKFTDSVAIAQSAIEEFEEKTIYVRAMRCRILIARVYLVILKLDKAMKLLVYVESFAKQFNLVILTDECHVLRSGIFFFKNDYDKSLKELELHTNQESRWLVLPRFRNYLMNKDKRLFGFHDEIMETKQNIITENKYLLIKILMMWVNSETRNDIEYVHSLNKLREISINTNEQELIGLTHNLLIEFYKEKRKYKRALEISEALLKSKKIHISFYSIKNNT